jgi:hypothetical protein
LGFAERAANRSRWVMARVCVHPASDVKPLNVICVICGSILRFLRREFFVSIRVHSRFGLKDPPVVPDPD